MHAAIRSTVIGAVTLVGAGAVAVSPIASTPPDLLLRQQSVTLTAKSEQPLDPSEELARIHQQYIADLAAVRRAELDNPAPILRAILQNRTRYDAALDSANVEAGLRRDRVLRGVPEVLGKAAAQLSKGDAKGAFTTFDEGTLVPLRQANAPVDRAREEIRIAQLQTIQRVAQVAPEAIGRVVDATSYGIQQTIQAQIQTLIDVRDAAATGDPTQVSNAIALGRVRVARVIEERFYAYNSYDDEWEGPVEELANELQSTKKVIDIRRASVAQEFVYSRRLIADAISSRKYQEYEGEVRLEVRKSVAEQEVTAAAASKPASKSAVSAAKAAKAADHRTGGSKRKQAAAAK